MNLSNDRTNREENSSRKPDPSTKPSGKADQVSKIALSSEGAFFKSKPEGQARFVNSSTQALLTILNAFSAFLDGFVARVGFLDDFSSRFVRSLLKLMV